MLSPGLVPPGPGVEMELNCYQSRRISRSATVVRSPTRIPLLAAGPGYLRRTGRAVAVVGPVCSRRRCRVLVPRPRRHPDGRRRLGSGSQSAGSAPLGLGAQGRAPEMHCWSEEVAVEAGSAVVALRLPSTAAVED